MKEANNFSGPPNSNTQGTKMERLYAELSEYYVFDKAKYTLEEFFGDIKTFKDQFKQAYDSMLKEREAEAKLARAREAREKADKERSDRAAKKRALVDFNADDNQEGVMDSLLEALKTGTAFSRDQKRKRAARPAGGVRKAQLNRSRSRGPSGHGGNKEIVDILLEDENEPPMGGGRRERRPNRGPASQIGYQRERDVTGMVGSTGVNGTDDSDELMRKLRAL